MEHFLTQMPTHFRVESEGPMIMTGVVIDVDVATGKALAIKQD